MPRHWLLMDKSDPDGCQFRTRLAGAGRHLPATHLTTEELMSATSHRTHIDLERLTGIHERRISVGDEDSLSLATSAALDCLDKAGLRPCVAGCGDQLQHNETPRRTEPMAGAVNGQCRRACHRG